jgi:septal ring factor EnvC (AmiA/AmiB activator)
LSVGQTPAGRQRPSKTVARWAPCVLTTLCALAMLIAADIAQGADIGTLQTRVDQARQEARTLGSSLQLRTAELTAAQGRAAAAGRRQAELEATLARGVARARKLEAQVTAAQERLARAQDRFRRVQGMLARRLVAIYKSDPPDLATVLLEADGFSDLLTRTAYLQEINQADMALVNRVQELRDQVRTAVARVRAMRAEAAAEVERVAAARNEIAHIRAAAAQRAAGLAKARAAAQASLSDLRSRMAGWTAQMRDLQQAAGTPGDAAGAVQQWFGDFAIPNGIVKCESGGNYGALNPSSGAGGAYQMLPETYKGLGGQHAAPHVAPKSEQDRLAAKLWDGGRGRGNWEC